MAKTNSVLSKGRISATNGRAKPSSSPAYHLARAAAALRRAEWALQHGHLETAAYELKKVGRISREVRALIARLAVNGHTEGTPDSAEA
jgi:hypothetical protein